MNSFPPSVSILHSTIGKVEKHAAFQEISVTQTESIGVVETSDGVVTATNSDGVSRSLSVGDPVFQGDVIQTADASSIGITFIDTSTFSLDENGELTLDELVYDPDNGEGTFSSSVTAGVFSFVSGSIAKLAPDAMEISTPVATIGIRGTQGVINQQESGQMEVALLQELDGTTGEILLTNSAGSIVLNQPNQFSAVLSFTSSPSAPVVINTVEIASAFGTRSIQVVNQSRASAVQRRAEQAEAEAEAEAVAAEAAEVEAAESEAEAEALSQAAAEAEAAAALAEGAEAEALLAEAEQLLVEAALAEAAALAAAEEAALLNEAALLAAQVAQEAALEASLIIEAQQNFESQIEGLQEQIQQIINETVPPQEPQNTQGEQDTIVAETPQGPEEEIIFSSDTILPDVVEVILNDAEIETVLDLLQGIVDDAIEDDAPIIRGLVGLGNNNEDEDDIDNIILTIAPPQEQFASVFEELSETNDEFVGELSENYLISGLSGNDYIEGNFGNDVIVGGVGNDDLDGKDGNDIIHGDVALNEGAFSDLYTRFISLGDIMASGTDSLWGGDGDDTLYGGYGNDRLYGFTNDSDFVNSGSVTTDHDVLYGGAGSDVIYGEYGDDTLYGEEGDDSLYGGVGSDSISGGAGADTLYGNAGVDYLEGGDGDDKLYDGAGLDSLYGNDGNDTLYASQDGGYDYFSGGGGSEDRLDLQDTFSSATTIILDGRDTGSFTDGVENEFNQMDIIFATKQDDVITIEDDGSASEIHGRLGNDTINISAKSGSSASFDVRGNGGNDMINILSDATNISNFVIRGDSGDDTVNVSDYARLADGNVTLDGGGNDDTLVFNNSSNETINAANFDFRDFEVVNITGQTGVNNSFFLDTTSLKDNENLLEIIGDSGDSVTLSSEYSRNTGQDTNGFIAYSATTSTSPASTGIVRISTEINSGDITIL